MEVVMLDYKLDAMFDHNIPMYNEEKLRRTRHKNDLKQALLLYKELEAFRKRNRQDLLWTVIVITSLIISSGMAHAI